MARMENLLGALSLTMSDRLRAVGAGHGMSTSEQAALVTLLSHPDVAVSWLGEVLGLTSSGVTRLVDRLVERGWVSRSPGSDARQRRLRLTSSGTKRAQVLLRERDATLAEAVDSLGEADRTEFESLLSRVVGSLAREYVPALRTCRLCDRDTCSSGDEVCPLRHTVPDEARP